MSTSQMMDLAQIEQVLKDVEYKGWKFKVLQEESRYLLQVGFLSECSVTKEMELQKGRKWALSPYMTKSELVQTALKAVLSAEEHEAREAFRYKGAPIFGPHFDVENLVDVCAKNFDIRNPI